MLQNKIYNFRRKIKLKNDETKKIIRTCSHKFLLFDKGIFENKLLR